MIRLSGNLSSLLCFASSPLASPSSASSQPSVLELLWQGWHSMQYAERTAPAVPSWLLALVLFTLFIVPAAYIWIDEWRRAARKRKNEN